MAETENGIEGVSVSLILGWGDLEVIDRGAAMIGLSRVEFIRRAVVREATRLAERRLIDPASVGESEVPPSEATALPLAGLFACGRF